MSFFLVGFIAAIIGAIPLDFERGWQTKSLALGVGGFILFSMVTYVTMPQLVGPFWGGGMITTALMALAANAFWSMARTSGHKVNATPIAIFGLVLSLPVIAAIFGSGIFRASDYHAIVGNDVEAREWSSDMAPVDNVHIRMVSKAQATWRANKVLGQGDGSLGSRYKVGDLSIQKVGDELVWVAPLEFQGFASWQSWGHTPGYVMVSAEDPRREAELVIGHEMKYVPTAYFASNLERHIYTSGYQFSGTTDYTFEIDDEGKPHFVITVFEPTIMYSGEQILGVLVVDPVNGEMQEYSLEEAPAWIDRAVPESFAIDRLVWYGSYEKGWWNSFWRQEGVEVPTTVGTSRDMWLTWGDDGEAYWFSGLTSIKNTDQSLVGFVLVNSRTGHTQTYRISGDDESGIIATVNSEVSNYSGWYATQPILYNVYGELTWVVPVVSQEGIFKKIAFVHASTQQVALGDNKRKGLLEYKRLLAESGNRTAPTSDSDLKMISGVVERFACPVEEGNTMCYVVIHADHVDRIFTGSTTVSPELPIARVGDYVAITFIETGEGTVPMEDFDLHGFDTRRSPQQGEAEELYDQGEAQVDQRHDARDIRAEIGNMDDEELLQHFGDPDDQN